MKKKNELVIVYSFIKNVPIIPYYIYRVCVCMGFHNTVEK